MDLLRQFYVLPHWDRSCKPNFPSHPVTVYWHRANQSQHWPYNTRRLAGWPLQCQFWSHWYDSTLKKSWHKRDSNLESSTLEADALTTRPTRRSPKSVNWPMRNQHTENDLYSYWNHHLDNLVDKVWGVAVQIAAEADSWFTSGYPVWYLVFWDRYWDWLALCHYTLAECDSKFDLPLFFLRVAAHKTISADANLKYFFVCYYDINSECPMPHDTSEIVQPWTAPKAQLKLIWLYKICRKPQRAFHALNAWRC